ncbi:hypothetical protein P8C59_005354 [Phyllachora maydis]|uniref:Mitochondrial protein n=1 Tax=Phyllachora maydis TaxID=1825666 RepID=A0AAD9MC65_9PEZI|nr:hypothetical protein P8C59_005354 [Phyllachora maydis]
MEIKLYQSLVGTAIYIMLFTRVDISFTIQWLSRSLNRPTKSHLNAAKNLFKYLNSTKDYSICFSYNLNTVANLGPKLSNSSNTTTKLSRDFYSKEGPRPLTTTSTTIVDSRNGKGSSRTSIINSSLVPIGFSNSDFAGDKATSKSTYSYLYKLAALYARTKHTLLKFRYVREQVKAKIVTIIYLNTKLLPTYIAGYKEGSVSSYVYTVYGTTRRCKYAYTTSGNTSSSDGKFVV